ncbi:hypothetical protein D3C72_1207290 [compost metagenome]
MVHFPVVYGHIIYSSNMPVLLLIVCAMQFSRPDGLYTPLQGGFAQIYLKGLSVQVPAKSIGIAQVIGNLHAITTPIGLYAHAVYCRDLPCPILCPVFGQSQSPENAPGSGWQTFPDARYRRRQLIDQHNIIVPGEGDGGCTAGHAPSDDHYFCFVFVVYSIH